MTNKAKRSAIIFSSYVCSIVPPCVAVGEYIPLWSTQVTSGEDVVKYTFGGLSLVGIIAAITMWRYLKDKFKSPSPLAIWLIASIAFVGLKQIIDVATVVSIAGLAGCSAGTVLYKIADKYKERSVIDGQQQTII